MRRGDASPNLNTTLAGTTNRGLIGLNPYYADTPILYTAAGGNFTGGQVRMTIHYFKPTWATS
jgi:hypothetical protein